MSFEPGLVIPPMGSPFKSEVEELESHLAEAEQIIDEKNIIIEAQRLIIESMRKPKIEFRPGCAGYCESHDNDWIPMP